MGKKLSSLIATNGWDLAAMNRGFAAVVGLLAWGLLLSYVEMVEIIFDTLVPR